MDIPFILSTLLSTTLFLLISSASTNTTLCTPHDLDIAKEEMRKANHFAFVMLVSMSPADRFPGNITFLMPNNRVLAETTIPENSVLDFLLRHSIPSPLLFEHLRHFPTGSVLPSSEPDFSLRITNNGTRSTFSLNNVRIVSPNICVAGKSIRCHGIDGVLLDTSNVPSSPTCSTDTPITEALPPMLPSPPPAHNFNLTPAAASQPIGPSSHPHKSGTSRQSSMCGILGHLATWMTMLTLLFYR
ncbi:hypothetical protein Dimus_000025 [Dionaea muscipula]